MGSLLTLEDVNKQIELKRKELNILYEQRRAICTHSNIIHVGFKGDGG